MVNILLSNTIMIIGVNHFKCSGKFDSIDHYNMDEFYSAYKHMLDKIQKMVPDEKVIFGILTYCN